LSPLAFFPSRFSSLVSLDPSFLRFLFPPLLFLFLPVYA
jgi:hypothetical protein